MVVNRDGQKPMLVLRPFASFGAAVRAVSAVCPRTSEDDVRRLVRKHLPHALDLDDLLPTDNPMGVVSDGAAAQAFPLRSVLIPILVVTVLLSIGFYAINIDARHRLRGYRQYRLDGSIPSLVNDTAVGATDTAHGMLSEARAYLGVGKAPANKARASRVARHLLAVRNHAGQKGGSSVPAAAGVAHGSGPLVVAGPDDHGSFDPKELDACPRSVLDTLAVANLSDGPTSSTSISNEVRLAPSLVSYDLALSLPCTITRMPRWSDSATFSAAPRQTAQRMNSASPSTQESPSLRRGVDATVKLQTAAPDGVNLSSGSSVRLPTSVSTGSPATGGTSSLVGGTLDTVANTVGSLLGD